jgi:predicted GNAT family acetyltransferase
VADPDRLAALPPAGVRVLDGSNVAEMLALVALTKPGPFEARTIELGRYLGVFADGRLVAMAGERFHLDGHTEVSAVCTHPDAQGRGLGAALTHAVAAGILERGERAFLHVAEDNHTARRVYERLGFTTRAMVDVLVARPPEAPPQ